MTSNQNNKQESLKELSQLAYNLFEVQKKSPSEVKTIFIQKGLDEVNAGNLVEHLDIKIKTDKEQAKKDRDNGIIWFFGGIVVTGISYLFSDYMGIYFITWGAVLYGTYLFIKGYYNR